MVTLCGLVAFACLPFFAGLSAPYLFDDYSNLLDNVYVRITTIDYDSLRHASFSLAAGPLKRPVAMFTFAVNHFVAGSFAHIEAFRIVNIAIHAVNGLLVFFLARLILCRRAFVIGVSDPTNPTPAKSFWPATAVAILWVAHPIQVTSTLYIVQRMTEMSAMFVLLGLITFLANRDLATSGNSRCAWIAFLGPLLFGTLGTLCKETALLLPVYILIIEFTLFPNENPWRKWKRIPPRQKTLVGITIAVIVLAASVAAFSYARSGYMFRDFTMSERVMTEARVLWFYLSLMIVPRLDEFALLHDDIVLSHSLVNPWTTLPALLGLIFLISAAFLWRRRLPLFSLGLLWFFGAHLLESTIFALEIAHEHRNYLALFGICLAATELAAHAATKIRRVLIWAMASLIIITFAVVTGIRANQWGSAASFFHYESAHHPNSPGAQSGMGTYLASTGDYAGAILAYRRAAALDENEAAYLMGILLISAKHGLVPQSEDAVEADRRMKQQTISATTGMTLETINRCIIDECRKLQSAMETWMNTLISKNDPAEEISYYHYLLGRTLFGQGRINEAVAALGRSHELDRAYLLPLLELANIYIVTGQLKSAEAIVEHLRILNKTNLHPRHAEVEQLKAEIARISNKKTGPRYADDRAQ